MNFLVLLALVVIAGTVNSANVTTTTAKPVATTQKSVSAAKITAPTVRPLPMFQQPALFPSRVQNFAPRPLQQFAQTAFQPQAQFPQNFATQQSFSQQPIQQNFLPQPPQHNFFPGQFPAFQQQFAQQQFAQQPRNVQQAGTQALIASNSSPVPNSNVRPNLPQSSTFAPTRPLAQPITQQQITFANSAVKSNAFFKSKVQSPKPLPVFQQVQPQQQIPLPAVQPQIPVANAQPFQPFQPRASTQQAQVFQQIPPNGLQGFQPQAFNPSTNAQAFQGFQPQPLSPTASGQQPFQGFQQFQAQANPIAPVQQAFPGFQSQPFNPNIQNSFQGFQPVNPFGSQQAFPGFQQPEIQPFNPAPANSFFPQTQQQFPQFTV